MTHFADPKAQSVRANGWGWPLLWPWRASSAAKCAPLVGKVRLPVRHAGAPKLLSYVSPSLQQMAWAHNAQGDRGMDRRKTLANNQDRFRTKTAKVTPARRMELKKLESGCCWGWFFKSFKNGSKNILPCFMLIRLLSLE